MRKSAKIGLIILVQILLFARLYAQYPSVSLHSDNLTPVLGDKITLSIQLSGAIDNNYYIQNVNLDYGKLEKLSEKAWESVKSGDRVVFTKKYLFSFYDEGEFEIKPVSINYKKPGSIEPLTITSNPLKIKYSLVIVDTTKPFKTVMDPPIAAPAPDAGLALFIGACVLILLISIAAIIYTKRKKKIVPAIVPVEQEEVFDKDALPYSIIEKLKELEAQKLQEKGQVKEHFKIVTDILREYVLTAFDVDARVLTGSEIYLELKELLSESLCEDFRNIFESCDLVKFAPKIVLNKENTSVVRLSQRFVMESYKEFKSKTL